MTSKAATPGCRPRPAPRWARAGAAIAALAATLALPFPAAAHANGTTSVVVLEATGAGGGPEHAVARLGGQVERQLPIVGGFAAEVPTSAVDDLRATAGVRGVHGDRKFTVRSDEQPEATAGAELSQVRGALGAASAGTGAGVDIALVDTGVSPVRGLDAGQVVNAPDFSSHAGDPAHRHLDAFGHGTHLAGVIAAGDTENDLVGVAPGARVVNVKVADHEGSTSLSRLLAAIDWVVRHKDDEGLRIRVLNLAFGAETSGDYTGDPLAFAVEQAWRRGIVVVTAAGNGGPETPQLDSPAFDPHVLAVGASDMLDTPVVEDDRLAGFSSFGTAERAPDVVAPGVGIVSLRVPGAFLDEAFPNARVGDGVAFRGSGTSQASAAVSATVALLLEQRPDLTPDAVKALLRGTARPLADADVRGQGAGLVDLAAAMTAPASAAPQTYPSAHGSGPWRARSGVGLQLAVEDPRATRWSATRWSATRWSATRWSATRWSATRWSATRWSATRWSATRWSATRWSATRWSATRWSATRWSSVGWSDGTS